MYYEEYSKVQNFHGCSFFEGEGEGDGMDTFDTIVKNPMHSTGFLLVITSWLT